MHIKLINVLGFDGNSLAVLFDILLSLGFNGHVNILKNDERQAKVDFDLGIEFSLMKIGIIPGDLQGEFLICSSNPYAKYYLINVFNKYLPDLEDRLLTLIHPATYIGRRTFASNGVIIEPGVVVSSFTRLGRGVYIGRGATIGHHNEIGEYATINPGANLTGNVRVGEYATIGPGSTVVSGISIGEKSVIGAGSVVTRDIPPGVVAYGNPCKVMRENTFWKI